MTAAGVGSLLICQRQLDRFRQSKQRRQPAADPPARRRARARTTRSTTSIGQDRRRPCKKGMAWLGANYFTTNPQRVIGQSIYYGLYGIERIGALADRQTLGRADWFEQGRSFIRSSQRPDGSWHARASTDDMNTVWAILFLTKSTAKTIQRIEVKRLGAGTLARRPRAAQGPVVDDGRRRPGREPADERRRRGDARRARGPARPGRRLGPRRPDRPLPDAKGPTSCGPSRTGSASCSTDRDPGLRQVAAWALARTGDLDVVPDPDRAPWSTPTRTSSIAARLGLQLLSRKIDGLGPAHPVDPRAAGRGRPEAGGPGTTRSARSRPTVRGEGHPEAAAAGRPRPAAALRSRRPSP